MVENTARRDREHQMTAETRSVLNGLLARTADLSGRRFIFCNRSVIWTRAWPLNNSLFWDDKYCEGRKLVKGLMLLANKLIMTLIRSFDWIRVSVDWLCFVIFGPVLYVVLIYELSRRGTAFETLVPIAVVVGGLMWLAGRYLKRQLAQRLENVKREWNQ